MKLEQRPDGAIVRTAETAKEREWIRKSSPKQSFNFIPRPAGSNYQLASIKNNRKRSRGRIVIVTNVLSKSKDSPLQAISAHREIIGTKQLRLRKL